MCMFLMVRKGSCMFVKVRGGSPGTRFARCYTYFKNFYQNNIILSNVCVLDGS